MTRLILGGRKEGKGGVDDGKDSTRMSEITAQTARYIVMYRLLVGESGELLKPHRLDQRVRLPAGVFVWGSVKLTTSFAIKPSRHFFNLLNVSHCQS